MSTYTNWFYLVWLAIHTRHITCSQITGCHWTDLKTVDYQLLFISEQFVSEQIPEWHYFLFLCRDEEWFAEKSYIEIVNILIYVIILKIRLFTVNCVPIYCCVIRVSWQIIVVKSSSSPQPTSILVKCGGINYEEWVQFPYRTNIVYLGIICQC